MQRMFWRLVSERGSTEGDDDLDDDLDDDGVVIDDASDKVDDKKKEDDDQDDADVGKNDDGSLTVDLDGDDEKKAKRENAFAKMRVENKKLREDLERARVAQQAQPNPAYPPNQVPYTPQANRPVYRGIPVPQTDEEWNELAQKDWKLAVDMRSHERAQEIVRASSQASQESTVLETSKSKVLSRHPELNDASSEKSQVYMKILQENPRYLTDPKGPVHAMRDMEEYMETVLGYEPSDIVKARAAGADKERMRVSRASLAASAGRIQPKQGNTIVLTKDELEFCKFNEINPKDYALNKKRMGSKNNGGIQV